MCSSDLEKKHDTKYHIRVDINKLSIMTRGNDRHARTKEIKIKHMFYEYINVLSREKIVL